LLFHIEALTHYQIKNMNFTAIDFETAIRHHICAVGIVTVENGTIVDEYHTLIQPPNNEYNWYNTQVHGITEYTTQDADNFAKIYPEIKKRIGGKVVVAHNESFDRNVLSKTMADFNISYADLALPERWVCTMKLCKSNGYPSGKLNECCQVHDIELVHHEALSDARACAKLYLELQKRL
jgi:DNA polymerase-3 subunit epsilon